MPGRIWVAVLLVVAFALAVAIRVSDPGGAAPDPVRVSAGAVTVVEGDTGTRLVPIPVTLSTPARASIRVHYSIGAYRYRGAASVSASDVEFASGTLHFDVSPETGLTPDQLNVPMRVRSDSVAEPIESYALTLSELSVHGPPGTAVITTPVAVGSIFDDDASGATGVSIGSVTMSEGGPGVTHTAAVPVTLSAPMSSAVSVDYVVKSITAVHGVDYAGPESGTLTFPPGVDARTIDIPVLGGGGGHAERDETLSIGLSAPAGVALGTALGVVLVRAPEALGAAPGPRVTITGDSITDLSEPALRRAFTSTPSTSIVAVPGATMATMTPFLRDQLGTAPDAVVINLGTNDALTDNPHWARDLATIRAAVAGLPCVEFVTMNDVAADRMGSYFVRRPVTVAAQINAALHEAAATSPNIHLVDWKAAADADAAAGGPNALTADSIHPTPLGQAWLAQHIRRAIDRDCR